MVKWLVLLLLLLAALLWPVSVQAPEPEDFIPKDIGQASLIACWVGGNADGSTDTLVMVGYSHEVKTAYRALISKRPGAELAIEDCREWFERAKKALVEAGKHRKP